MNGLYVMDACALIASLAGEDGAENVHKILNAAFDGNINIIMNKINLLEVYYDVYRTYGQKNALKFLSDIKLIPIEINSEITDDLLKEAGKFKITYKISLADSILLAEAKINKASVITADHHEFNIIEKSENMNFFWIR
jgi:PIN domain nuclease of toxin-antitoxin system